MTRTLIIIFITLSFSCTLYAEHIPQKEAEKTILRYFKKMKYWRKQKSEHSIDSVYAVNKLLDQAMSDMGYEGYAITADFKDLVAAGMQIHTSDDKMVRTFCWEVVAYGTAHYYNYMVAYYQSAARSMNFVNKDGTSMTDIYTIQKFDGDNVYLLHEENRYDYRNRVSRYMAHILKNGYLTLNVFFYNNTDSQTFAGYNYSLPSFSFKEKNLPQIHFSQDKRQLFIPIIGKGGSFTGGELIYRYDGKRFAYDTYTEKKK